MGAGKSTALAALRGLGAAVLSSDEVVHELYRSEPVLDAVSERWGAALAPGGVIDRSKVAQRVFADAEERAWLEGLLWPLVAQRIADWLEQARAASPPPRAAVVEVPLLFEAGMQDLYDATIAVIATESLRRKRAEGRGHALADERSERQLSQEEKARRATYTVTNDGSEEDLQARLAEILAELGEPRRRSREPSSEVSAPHEKLER
jgi:dephospho-CoA kinase